MQPVYSSSIAEDASIPKRNFVEQASARTKTLPAEWGGWGGFLVLLLLQVGLLCGGMERSLHGSTDFRAFYGAGKLLVSHHGDQIYDPAVQKQVQCSWISNNDQTLPFLYPAFAAVVFAPLGYLPYRYAFIVFAAINIAILVLLMRWVANELGLRHRVSWLACALTFGSVSIAIALLQGQISCLLLCVFVGALTLLRRKHEFAAGLVLSLCFAKFQLAIPIALLLCAWRRWRMVRGIACGATVLGLLSVTIAGLAGTKQYVHMMSGLTQATASNPVAAKASYGMFPSDMPNFHGLSYVLTGGRPVSLLITVLLSGLLMLWAAKRDRGLPAALCVALLVSYHFQAYDLVLLLIPLSVSLGELIRQRNGAFPKRFDEEHRAWRLRFPLVLAGCALLSVPVGAAIVYHRWSWVFCAATGAVLMSLAPTWTTEVTAAEQERLPGGFAVSSL